LKSITPQKLSQREKPVRIIKIIIIKKIIGSASSGLRLTLEPNKRQNVQKTQFYQFIRRFIKCFQRNQLGAKKTSSKKFRTNLYQNY
jgi:hypothetical protein